VGDAVPDPSSLTKNSLSWQRRAALAFAMLFPPVMAWVYFVVLAAPQSDSPPTSAALAAYSGSKLVQFAFPVLWVLCFERSRLRPKRASGRGLGLGLGFAVLVGAIILAAYFGLLRHHRLLAHTPDKIVAKLAQFHVATPAQYLLLAVFIAGVHSFLEEYYWRWFVFDELRRQIPAAAAIVISSLAFMAHHVIILGVYVPGKFWSLAVPFSLCVAAGGAYWAWLYQRTGAIYASWLSHLLVDAAILAVGYDMVYSR
jgi:uncharacterized protein